MVERRCALCDQPKGLPKIVIPCDDTDGLIIVGPLGRRICGECTRTAVACWARLVGKSPPDDPLRAGA